MLSCSSVTLKYLPLGQGLTYNGRLYGTLRTSIHFQYPIKFDPAS